MYKRVTTVMRVTAEPIMNEARAGIFQCSINLNCDVNVKWNINFPCTSVRDQRERCVCFRMLFADPAVHVTTRAERPKTNPAYSSLCRTRWPRADFLNAIISDDVRRDAASLTRRENRAVQTNRKRTRWFLRPLRKTKAIVRVFG